MNVFIVSFQSQTIKASPLEIIVNCVAEYMKMKGGKKTKITSISALSTVIAIGPHCEKICTFKQYAHFMCSIIEFVLAQT